MGWKNDEVPRLSNPLYSKPIQIGWATTEHVDVGLQNAKNTCFVNATIQALFHIPCFLNYIDDEGHRKGCFSLLRCVRCALYRTFLNMKLHKNSPPQAILQLLPLMMPKYVRGKQEDGHEFLKVLLDRMDNEFLRAHPTKDYCLQQTTGIGQIFTGWIKSSVRCSLCKVESATYAPRAEVIVECNQESLQTAINEQMNWEVLDSTCKCGKEKMKKETYHIYPNVLKLMMKRFDPFTALKCETKIDIPQKVKLEDVEYKFVSGIVHLGPLRENGHYVCVTSCPDGSSTLFDDLKVTKLDDLSLKDKSITTGMYIMFYERQKALNLKNVPNKSIKDKAVQNIVGNAIKRPLPWSPTKSSPLQKRLHIFSPSKQLSGLFKAPFGFAHQKSPLHDKQVLREKLFSTNMKCSWLLNASKPKFHSFNESSPLEKQRLTTGKVSLSPARSKKSIRKLSLVFSPRKFRDQDKVDDLLALPLMDPADSSPAPIKAQRKRKFQNFFQDAKRIETDSQTECGVVTPIKIIKTRKDSTKKDPAHDNESSYQSSHDYRIEHHQEIETDSQTECGVVTPIKIIKSRKDSTKKDPAHDNESSYQSSHDYRIEHHQEIETDSQTECGVVTPIKIIKSRKDSTKKDPAHDNESSYQSSHDYRIEHHQENTELSHDASHVNMEENLIGEEVDLTFNSGWDSPHGDLENLHEANFDFLPYDNIDELGANVIMNSPTFSEIIRDNVSDQQPHQNNNVNVVLLPEDVPGAILPRADIRSNTMKMLTRWLQCRRIPLGTKPRKDHLVALVKACIDQKRDHIIFSGIDQNRHYNAKRDKLVASQGINSGTPCIPCSGWDTFPSRDIPLNYNFGSVYHYLCETMPQYEGEDASELDSADSGGEEEAETVVINIQDPFQNDENDEMLNSKKMRRGLAYYKSNYIRTCQDTIVDRTHFYKGHVRASMNQKAYWVHVAVSQVSGRVVNCTCDQQCSQRALGRCSHVAAVLLFILGHARLNGYQSITCTSRPNEWNLGTLHRDPQVANERQYDSFKINVIRRATFDVRPTERQQCHPNQEEVNHLLASLSYKNSHWALILDLVYPEEEYDDYYLKEYYPTLRDQFYKFLKKLCDGLKPHLDYTGPIEVTDSRGQSTNDLWSHIRSLHVTASTCREVSHFKSESAKMHHLQKHMWNMNRVQTKAMKYGIEKEDTARSEYLTKKLQQDPTTRVRDTGLFLHTEFPGLSCSPDGLVTSAQHPPRLIEIKCPFTLRSCDPNEFEKVKNKYVSTYLKRSTHNNTIYVHKDHKFYDQMQMNMGITGIHNCDLVVWSNHGLLIIPVAFDELRWATIKVKLEQFHWRYQAPEYFLMRTVRGLAPQPID